MKLLVGAVMGAALVAGCLTFGLDALLAPRSDIAIARAGFDPEPRTDEPERTLPIVARAEIAQEQNSPLSTSEANASAFLLARSALWDEIVLFRGDLLRQQKGDSKGAAESAPTTLAIAEKSVVLPKPRPAGEQIVAASNLASPMNSADAVVAPQSSSITEFFEKIFRYAPKKAQFPAEASGRTAVYDIETRAVYLPTGEILEAHSGLGQHMDDVRYVRTKSRGPTPPNVYQLSLREKSFHGVQAIRLTPVGTSQMFGRDGILAHPYMLGANGQSNGCVSIQEYPKFLQAYLKGQVDHLIVVPSLAATADVVNASAAGSIKRASL